MKDLQEVKNNTSILCIKVQMEKKHADKKVTDDSRQKV